MSKRYSVTLAVPALVIMDLVSNSVDFPWWAYMIFILASIIQIYWSA